MGLGQKLTKEIIEEGIHLTSLVGKEATVTAQNIPTKFIKQSIKATSSTVDDAAKIALKSENEAVTALGKMKDEAVAMAPEYKATDAALRFQSESKNEFLKAKADYGGFSGEDFDAVADSVIDDAKHTVSVPGAYNKEWQDLQTYKAKNTADPLAEKLSGASETFEGTAATEKLSADTAATMASINEGRFFTSEFDRLSSNLKTSTGSMTPVTSSFTNPLTNPVYNPAAFGTEQQALKAKLEAKHYAGKTADEIRYDKYMRKNAQYNGSNAEKAALEKQSSQTPWSSTAKAALGTAVVGAGICATLSSSRGQQNNAQLYGQQPLY